MAEGEQNLSEEDLAFLDFAEGTTAAIDDVSPDAEDNTNTPTTEPTAVKASDTTAAATEVETPETEAVVEEGEEVPLTEREKVLLAELEKVTDVKPVSSTEIESATVNDSTQPYDFLANVDIDEVLSTTDGLNTLLNSVYNKAMSDASKLTAEQIMRSLPQVVTTYVQQHIAYRETVQDFYRENPDLVGVKKTLARVANEVTSEKPELTLDQVFTEAATRTRKLLGLRKSGLVTTQKEEHAKVAEKTKKPAFVQSKGRPKVGKLDGLAAEIDELINV